MNWYLVHTKPRQEHCALENLQNQGYACYLPLLACEKLLGGKLQASWAPLFPRYLFIQLNTELQGKSWAPIRSTKGVHRLVCFGSDPARVDPALVQGKRPANTS
jgi:transcriptional antiterminator RfaH